MHALAYINTLVHKLFHTVVTSVFFHSSLAHWICIEASHCIAVMQWFSRGSVIALDNLSLWQVEDFPQSSESTVSRICVGLYLFLSKKSLWFSWLHELHVNFCRFRKKKSTKKPFTWHFDSSPLSYRNSLRVICQSYSLRWWGWD